MLLVTGLTGHSGKYFVEELIKNKYDGNIRCIVRRNSDTSILDNSCLDIEKVIGDINDLEFLDKCMIGIDTIFHIINIRYTLPLVKLAVKNNIKRIICVHTTGIYSKFKAASEEYKQIEEELSRVVKQSDINLTILRPTMIFGDLCDHNMSKFIKMIDKLRIFPIINHGKCLIQPVNARDLGRAYYSVLMLQKEKAKTSYILSGEKTIPMLEAFKLISKNLGKKTVFISFPLGFGVLIAKTIKAITFSKIDFIEKVQRMSEDRCFSHEDAKNDFGYKPEQFEVGIAREVSEYLNR